MNTIQVLLVANLTALLVLVIIAIVRREFPRLKKTSFSELAFSALQGFLNPFLYYLLVFKAYSLLPAQIAQPANFVWPVVLMLLSVPLLKQPLRLIGFFALLISFTGVFVLSSQGNLSTFTIAEPVGISLALLSSLVWALFWILNLRDGRDDLMKLLLSFFFSLIYIMILAGVTGNFAPVFSKQIAAAVYIGIFEMGITYIFWLKALQLSESTWKISSFIYLTPFVSFIFIHFVLGERLYYTSPIGLCLIVSGILLAQIKTDRAC